MAMGFLDGGGEGGGGRKAWLSAGSSSCRLSERGRVTICPPPSGRLAILSLDVNGLGERPWLERRNGGERGVEATGGARSRESPPIYHAGLAGVRGRLTRIKRRGMSVRERSGMA